MARVPRSWNNTSTECKSRSPEKRQEQKKMNSVATEDSERRGDLHVKNQKSKQPQILISLNNNTNIN